MVKSPRASPTICPWGSASPIAGMAVLLLPAGLYFVRLVARDEMAVKKLAVVP